METENVKKEGKGRIFDNPFLEFFTKTSFWITFTFYPVFIAVFLYLNYRVNDFGLLRTTLIYLSGILFWSLQEYLMHRYVFHFVNESKAAQRFHYMIHGVHHEYPRDEERLFMPPLPGAVIISILTGLFSLVMGKAVLAFMPGLINGYLIYVYIHQAVHITKPSKLFRYWWKHHALHHYKYPDKAFGVSSPLWDYIFGTMPPRNRDGQRESDPAGAQGSLH